MIIWSSIISLKVCSHWNLRGRNNGVCNLSKKIIIKKLLIIYWKIKTLFLDSPFLGSRYMFYQVPLANDHIFINQKSQDRCFYRWCVSVFDRKWHACYLVLIFLEGWFVLSFERLLHPLSSSKMTIERGIPWWKCFGIFFESPTNFWSDNLQNHRDPWNSFHILPWFFIYNLLFFSWSYDLKILVLLSPSRVQFFCIRWI